jgi:hypothetical protein
MKYTINEFASQIRNLYPNDYNDLTDEKLVELWLKKYPEDIEKIDFRIEAPQKKSKNIIEYLIEGVFAIVVGGFLVTGVMYINDPENVKNKINSLGFTTTTNLSNNQPLFETPILNESKTNLKEYNTVDEVDKVLEPFEFSKTDINIIKNIYYDTDPDPENKVGLTCGPLEKNCKWCDASFAVEGQYMSYKSIVDLLIGPSGQYALILGSFSGNNASIKNDFKQICNNYLNGQKYDCVIASNASDFHSLECEIQYKDYKKANPYSGN